MKNNSSAGVTGREWTDPQKAGIQTIDKSLLVSAAAGSGKTTVLAERCVHLVCDANPKCRVDQLLVVTFTEAAAAEMKGRIHNALAQRQGRDASDSHIAHQLAIIDNAAVGTLHAFCARLLRQYFHLLGIDPDFVILDSDEADLLKLETARQLLADRFDQEDAGEFRGFVDHYGEGDDERIVRHVLRAHELLCSVVDPVGWMEQSLGRLDEAITHPLEKSELGKAFIVHIRRSLQSLLQSCQQAGEAIKSAGTFPAYLEQLRDHWKTIKHWIGVLDSHGLMGLIEEVQGFELPRLSPLSSSIPGKELAKDSIDAVRKSMKEGAWRAALLFTPQEWKEGLSRTVPHAEVFLSLVQDFTKRYSAAKTEETALDFSDLERLALRALREGGAGLHPSAVARSMQKQFRHVLVDEYQDINEVQDAILTLVSHESVAGMAGIVPNLFCVGDVKQSIYRFRLAEPALFLQRRDDYSKPQSHGVLIDLQHNFRSRGPLLEAINGVFERLMTAEAADLSYDPSQRLVPHMQFPTDSANLFTGAPIELHLACNDGSVGDESSENLDRTQREAALVADRVRRMLGKTGQPVMQVTERAGSIVTTRPIRFGDIVILLRSMQFKADLFAEALRNAGVPVHTESSTGYFEATEINDILSLLQILDNAQQDIPLAAVLRGPIAALSEPDDCLARIVLEYPDEPFHQAVTRYIDEQTNALADALKAFQKRLSVWRRLSRERPLAELIWTIYDQTGFLAFCSGLPNGEQRQANLIELHERARQFGSFRRQGLGRFLQFLEKLKSESDLGQASIASQAENVVRIMSIHRSKGLEFPVVIVGDLGKLINMQDAQGPILLDRKVGLGLQVVNLERRVRYPSLAWEVVQNRLRQQTIAEELRVLYVAMTRAKEHLILVGTCSAKQPAKWTSQWADHQGPLSAELVLGARCMLDWLGPAAAASPVGAFQVYQATAEEIGLLAADKTKTPAPDPMREALAALKPLDPRPPIPAVAQQVMDRLTEKYAFDFISRSPSTSSVTKQSKQSAPDQTKLDSMSAIDLDRLLPKPAVLDTELKLSAADRGTATHSVLEHLNFADVAGVAAIQKQIQKMVHSRHLTEAAAKCVDLEAIQWLLEQELGQLLIQQSGNLLREVPVYFPLPLPDMPATNPLDRQMIRGRIDVLIPVGDQYIIVDYKTDQVEGAALMERASIYGGQLALYKKAIETITGKTVKKSVLVFLHAKVEIVV